MELSRIGEWGEAHAGPPATEEELRECEDVLGHPLPGEHTELLRAANGLEGEYGLGLIWTTRQIRPAIADLFMPFDGLVFFADAGNGDQFGLSLTSRPQVYAWDHEDDSRRWVAAGVWRYLEEWLTGRLVL